MLWAPSIIPALGPLQSRPAWGCLETQGIGLHVRRLIEGNEALLTQFVLLALDPVSLVDPPHTSTPLDLET